MLERAGMFSDRRLWYDNSNGAAEIAVNQGAQTTSLLS
jgi:hypothetical protein